MSIDVHHKCFSLHIISLTNLLVTVSYHSYRDHLGHQEKMD